MEFVAVGNGFIGGVRIRSGATFEAPECFKASWAVPKGQPVAAAPARRSRKSPETLSEMGRAQESKTFVDLMKE